MLTPDVVNYFQQSGRPIAIVDIDGVTLDNNHRLPHIVYVNDEGKQVQREDADWAAFHAAGHLDPAGAAMPFIRLLGLTHTLAFVTARVAFGDQGAKLEARLNQELGDVPFIQIMREPYNTPEEGDPVTNHAEFKRLVIRKLKEHGLHVQVGIDDSLAICKMFTEEGLLSLRCHNHVPEAALWR